MTAQRAFYLDCDGPGCPERSAFGLTILDTRAAAYRKGWTLWRRGHSKVDFCPSHSLGVRDGKLLGGGR